MPILPVYVCIYLYIENNQDESDALVPEYPLLTSTFTINLSQGV